MNFLINTNQMNIYVSRLSYSTQSESLQNLFSQFGEVSSANIIMDRMTGRSRGFGFVEMPNEEEAQKAIDSLNESEFEGRTISVNIARPKEDRPASEGHGRGGFGGGRGGFGGGRGGFRGRNDR